MGTFFVRCKVENVSDRRKSALLSRMLVDAGSDYTWIPAATLEKLGIQREKKDVPFLMANGRQITRSVGFAIIHLDKFFTVDEVVFAEKGDLLLLGARTLEGLNLRVDARQKKLIAAGPLLAAVGAQRVSQVFFYD
jgi:predicted aspartyl protease